MTDEDVPPETFDGYARKHLGKTPRELAAMGDSELDVWQSRHPPDSHQFARAEREWQRRLIIEQLRAARFSAWLGAVATIIGAIFTFALGYYFGTSKTEQLYQPVPCPATTCNCTQNISSPLAAKK